MKKILASQLKALRKRARFSQKQIADLCGLTEPQYEAYEQARAEPSLDGLNALATCFGVSVDQLMGREPIEGINADESQKRRLKLPTPAPPWLVPLLPKLATLEKSEQKTLAAVLEALTTKKP
jgi:transcriptional regulator with XRE-family HTH domain